MPEQDATEIELDAADVVVVEESGEAETAEPVAFVADEVLLASAGLAQRALLEVTAPETVGSVVGHIAEGEQVLTLLFAADLAGYPGWHWSVTIARLDDAEPTVLETELMPGERALLAPEWVPWSERLAEYRAAQVAAAAEAAAAGDDELDDDADHDEASVDDEFDDDEAFDDDGDDDFDDDDLDEDGLDEDGLDEDGDDGPAADDDFDGIDIDALDEQQATDEQSATDDGDDELDAAGQASGADEPDDD